MTQNTPNNTLKTVFGWLQNLIELRLQTKATLNFETFCKDYPVPNKVTEGDAVYSNIVKTYKLIDAEQLVLLLSLSTYYMPGLFNSSLESGSNVLEQELFLNKSLVSKSNYPTIDTALYLLAGNLITERQKYFYLFQANSKLFAEDIIHTPNPPVGEAFTRSTLHPSQNILNNMLTGKNESPEYSHDFPASLIELDYTWDDLIVEHDTRKQLNEVKEWLKFIDICNSDNISINNFNKGFKSLFYGPPGTGKSMAASLIGKLTGHNVYRIDLSSIVSKYIGETEKNLGRVFDRAAHGNWILFFDEADALFGKRSTTQNAHDRYANQEVSYLLQRFETYEGVAILASNFKENIDSAFYRRFNNIVSFKKPEAEEREKLWRVHLPKDFKYADDINLNELAKSIKITGAGIHNVLRRSCMKSVLSGNKVIVGIDMLESIKLEFAKENKTL